MAMPNLSHEDLQKLKVFIDFVSSNPKILNFPQLDFVKKFIEKFGGKVPAGEFEMPGGGKCPFGGDGSGGAGVKCESGVPQADDSSEEPEEAMIDSDSESEVELDMDVEPDYSVYASKLPEINTVFLKETYRDKSRRGKSARSCQVKKEEHDEDDNSKLVDPINTTTEASIKVEMVYSDDDPFEDDNPNDTEYQGDYNSDEEVSSDSDNYGVFMLSDSSLEYAKSRKHSTRKTKKRSKKASKYSETLRSSKKIKTPSETVCGESCQRKCNSHFDKVQRKHLCDEFWKLKRVKRWEHILNFVEQKPTATYTVNRKTRHVKNVYYLPTSAGERVRVCMKFFMATLCIYFHMVKNALKYGEANVKTKICSMNEVPADTHEESALEIEFGESKKGLQLQEFEHNTVTLAAKPSRADALPKSSIQATTIAASSCDKSKKPQPLKKSYYKAVKKELHPRPLKQHERCVRKCSTLFSEETREQICAAFQAMDYTRRKDFVLSHIESVPLLTVTAKEYRKTNRAHRPYHNRFYFRGPRGEKIRVCERFFSATLCISRFFIRNALQHVDQHTGSYVGEDKRGRHDAANRTPEEVINSIRKHIESYPTSSPAKKTKTRYLPNSLTIRGMYQEYKTACMEEQRAVPSESMYRSVFNRDFRLAFQKPTTKHAHKMSSDAKGKGARKQATTTRGVNQNVSESTGQEGGFWTEPNTGTSIQNVPLGFGQPIQGYTHDFYQATAGAYLPPAGTQLHLQQDQDENFQNINYESAQNSSLFQS